MDVTVDRRELERGLQLASMAMGSMPEHERVEFSTEPGVMRGGALSLYACDNEAGVTVRVAANADTAANAAANGRAISRLVGNMSQPEVRIRISGHRLVLTSGRSKFTASPDVGDLPARAVSDRRGVVADGPTFAAAVGRVAFAVAPVSMGRPYLSVVNVEVDETGAGVVVASDGNRLAVCAFQATEWAVGALSVPVRAVKGIEGLAGAAEVRLRNADGACAIEGDVVSSWWALPGGAFPEWRDLQWREDAESAWLVRRADLLGLLKRAALLNMKTPTVRLSAWHGRMLAVVDAYDRGYFEERIDAWHPDPEAMIEESSPTITVNPHHLAAQVSQLGGEVVRIQPHKGPVRVSAEDDPTAWGLVMPVLG